MKTIAVVQARMDSTRFPGKVMHKVQGVPVIDLLLKRLSKSKKINEIILATTTNQIDDKLAIHVEKLGFNVFRGNENDVLDRYYHSAIQLDAGTIVRITGDCPLVDASLVDQLIDTFRKSNSDYVSNIHPPTYPDGLDIEVFSFAALKQAWHEAKDKYHREHVTPYIRESGLFRLGNLTSDIDYSSLRWTLDQLEDLQVIENIFRYFSPDLYFNWYEILKLVAHKPDFFVTNSHITRNEGGSLSTGQKLWSRAKKIIPGGSMLLSKRPEMFLPSKWPTYYKKAKDCRIWDLDGNEFIDMSLMGIGACTLGYANSEVDAAVRAAIDAGSMSTLNCPEDVYLAEKLVELHPWSDMVRFARTGGEANAIAIRIARAATGRDKVAFCGYHGWHDWYLSANLTETDNLMNHLLPGLEPRGVPTELKNTAYPFKYNQFDELEALINQHEIGVIKMEVTRNELPKNDFLLKVRKLATENNICLIFDECTSGFRQTLGGLHKLYKVEPDLAVFGKALGNGYAISAVLGRNDVMSAAQSTFISSTFWTEKIGPAAALKTLEIMERTRSYEAITETGKKINEGWKRLAREYDIDIKIKGIPALTSFTIPGQNMLALKTLITQEMLIKGFLATNTVYTCTEHSSDILECYFDALNPVFGKIKECVEGEDVHKLLQGSVSHAGFTRLN